jgi:hypothetical protein
MTANSYDKLQRLTNEVRYLYDGNLEIQWRDNFNLPTLTLTRGDDLSGTLEGAGGIGGLLARTDHRSLNTDHSYFFADGNGNDTVSYTYDNGRRRNGLSVQAPNASPWSQSYSQDAAKGLKVIEITLPPG